jgi:hypothetical protein
MDPVTAGILIATTVAGAATSAAASAQKNRAVARSQRAAKTAAYANVEQVDRRAQLEERRVEASRNRILAAVRARAAEAGGDTSTGSYAALARQTEYDAGLNTAIVRENNRLQRLSVLSGADANIVNLEGQRENALLSAFGGGVGGFSTGLSINNAIGSMGGGAAVDTTDYSGGVNI